MMCGTVSDFDNSDYWMWSWQSEQSDLSTSTRDHRIPRMPMKLSDPVTHQDKNCPIKKHCPVGKNQTNKINISDFLLCVFPSMIAISIESARQKIKIIKRRTRRCRNINLRPLRTPYDDVAALQAVLQLTHHWTEWNIQYSDVSTLVLSQSWSRLNVKRLTNKFLDLAICE